MCKNIERTVGNLTTGYKFVITDKHGHHYSPFTGIRYKKGPVPKWNKIGKYCIYDNVNSLFNSNGYWHNYNQSKYKLTAVIKDLRDVKNECQRFANSPYNSPLPVGCKFNIVKVTLSGDIYSGEFDDNYVELGNYIKSINVVPNCLNQEQL